MSDHAVLRGREVVPASLYDWGKSYEDRGNRHVGADNIEHALLGPLRVSTVFLGQDHGFGGRQLWFETMVFASPGGSDEKYMARYRTYDEAELGHQWLVRRLRAGAGFPEGYIVHELVGPNNPVPSDPSDVL